MEGQPQSNETLNIEQAEREIELVWQQINQFGGVSNEHDLIENLRKSLREGLITPENAVAKAHEIFHAKNGVDTHYR